MNPSRRNRGTEKSHAGFTLIEMMVAMALLLTIVGSIFWIVDPSQGISKTQPEVADIQQRMRVASDMLQKDLLMAGAGTYSGAIAGALANFFPPVLPYRSGAVNPDPELSYFEDRITITYVPDTASQTNVADAMPQPSSEIKVTAEPGCPSGDALCGFSEGMRVVIFDDTGAYDIFTITQVQTDSLHLQHRPPNPDFQKSYTPSEHARIAQVDNHVYWLNHTTSQLHHYNGFTDMPNEPADVPIVDNTVGLRFRYFGDPNPPLLPKPATGQENCLYTAAGNAKLPVLPSNGSSLIDLTPYISDQTPVCGQAPNRFDADLYRIRKVRVELRMQSGLPELRGLNPSGRTLFTNPGISRNPYRQVPDYAMEFEVAPRNLNLVR